MSSLTNFLNNYGLNKVDQHLVKLSTGFNESVFNTNKVKSGGQAYKSNITEHGKPLYEDMHDPRDYHTLNFAEVPYFDKTNNREALDSLKILALLKSGTHDNQFKELINHFQLGPNELKIILELYDKDRQKLFELFLSEIERRYKNHPFIRDKLLEMFPEIHEKRLDFFKTNVDFYRELAKTALYGVPKSQKDWYIRYYLSLGDLGSTDKDIEDKKLDEWVNKKYDPKIFHEFLHRGMDTVINKDGTKINGKDYLHGKNDEHNILLNPRITNKYNDTDFKPGIDFAYTQNNKTETPRFFNYRVPVSYNKKLSFWNPMSNPGNENEVHNYSYAKSDVLLKREYDDNQFRNVLFRDHNDISNTKDLRATNLLINKFI